MGNKREVTFKGGKGSPDLKNSIIDDTSDNIIKLACLLERIDRRHNVSEHDTKDSMLEPVSGTVVFF